MKTLDDYIFYMSKGLIVKEMNNSSILCSQILFISSWTSIIFFWERLYPQLHMLQVTPY